MKKIAKSLIISLFGLYSLFFVAASVLAPISANFGFYELSAKLTSLFMYSCHQAPDRSFWIMGYPVALCCRCLGVYVGVFIFAILSLLKKVRINLKTFVILSFVVLIDLFINYGFGIRTYNTGNVTRFVVGLIMGLLFISILEFIFERKSRD